MSKFYSNYCERNKYNCEKPEWLEKEEAINEAHKQHIIQAKQITTTKHVGSKNAHKLDYNAKDVNSRVQNVLNRYGLR